MSKILKFNIFINNVKSYLTAYSYSLEKQKYSLSVGKQKNLIVRSKCCTSYATRTMMTYKQQFSLRAHSVIIFVLKWQKKGWRVFKN